MKLSRYFFRVGLLLMIIFPASANQSYEGWIAYPVANSALQTQTIGLINPITLEKEYFYVGSYDAESLQWTPTYEEIIYWASGDLFMLDVTSERTYQLTFGLDVSYYDLSSDSSTIAYLNRAESQIGIINYNGRRLYQVQIPNLARHPIIFSQDGSRLYFVLDDMSTHYLDTMSYEIVEVMGDTSIESNEGVLYSVQSVHDNFSQLMVIDEETNQVSSIDIGSDYAHAPYFALDNEMVVFFRTSEDYSESSIALLDLSTMEIIPIHVDKLMGYDISPDGETLVYIKGVDWSGGQLCLQSLITFEETCISNNVFRLGSPAWSA